jgi:hypothetical protein
MSSILKKILADHAKRPIDPNPPWGYEPSEAVKILKLRLEKSTAPESITLAEAAKQLAKKDPAFLELAKSLGVTEEDLRRVTVPLDTGVPQMVQHPDGSVHPVQMGPQTRHHIEHLERQLVMERLRVKELRAQMMDQSAELAVLQEAGNSDLVEDYEGLSAEDVIPWVERVLLPAYGLAVAKLRGVALGALLILSALPIQAGDEWGRERTRDRSRESTDWSDSRESRESSDWSSDWGGGGTIPPSVPEPGSAAGLLVVAGAALVLRRQVGRRGR